MATRKIVAKADKAVMAALRLSEKQTQEALAFRSKARSKRQRVINQKIRAAQAEPLRSGSKALLAGLAAAPGELLGVSNTGVLVAEGDSWFNYPRFDVLKELEDSHGFEVESVAHAGDPVEGMAYGEGQLDAFIRTLEKVKRRGPVAPRAVLLSGGGNDIAGTEFGMLLNHANSSIAGFNDDVLRGVIDQRIKTAYVFMLNKVTLTCQDLFGKALPILVHGYDYPVADGRGFLGGFWILPGPWLDPGFREKGYPNQTAADRTKRVQMMQAVIDQFNRMLKDLTSLDVFSHVKYVDLRGTLSNGADWKTWWGNELHPTERGFQTVADRFAQEIGNLP